ncbi:hypothetical protein AB1Y20_001787 [Prymnesium parvum]|uniref:J domain-containing protein n=1 Tax=Prymnesium parvum TaxID=97485 RepID=A0AB34KDH1_PRYPA
MLESTAAEARQRYAEAVAVVKRGLGEHAALDIAVEEVDSLALLLLARHSHAADGLQMLYGVVDLLEDAGCLRLPSEASLDEREPDLQRLLVQLSASHAVKAETAALKKCAVGLEKSARQRGARGREPITPLLLWRRHYAEATPPPSRKLKPPPPPPENAWQLLIPDRAPSSVSKAELSKLFKKWMLRNHPDKGGDQDLAARVSAHYSHALGRDQTSDEERNEDVVFSQQQQQAEADWASYKRQCSEQETNSTEPNLDARALPIAREPLLAGVVSIPGLLGPAPLESTAAESSASKSEPPPLPESVRVECTPRKLTSLRRTSSAPGITRNSPVLAFGSRAPSPLRDKASQERERAAIVFENCTAEGEGLHLAFPNTLGHFIIQARDKLYLPVACDIDAFSVQIRGKQHVSPAVSAPGDGSSIRVQYEIAVCGSYKVHVRGGKKGVHVIGSPFTLIVKPAPASAEHCTAEGAALYRTRAGEQARKSVPARLLVRYNRLHDVVDRGDGTFQVSYSTHRAGDLFVHVLLALSSPTPISGSPFALKVVPASLAAAECELIAPAAGGGLSVDGIRVQPGEGLAGAYQLVIWEDDESNETRSQMALRDGSGKMDVGPRFNANGARLPGSSSSTVVLTMGIAVMPGLLSMRHSQVQLPQNLREPPCAGQTFSIGLKGFDRHANPLNTSGGVRLMLTQVTTPPPSAFNSDTPPVHLQHVDHRNGMHELRITAYRAGDYQLMLSAVPLSIHGRDDETHQTASAVLKGTEGGRILKLRVMPGELDASKCVLRTVGGAAARTTTPSNANPTSMQPLLHAPSDLRVGSWNSMILQCADSYGNVRSAMQAQASELHLELHECTPEGTKHDPLDATRWLRSEQRLNEDGSIWLRYAPLAAGALSLSIKLNGQHVLGSPILLKVNVGAIAYASCELLGEGISFCRRGLPAKFKIAARDAFGNARSRGGDGFTVTLLSCDGGVGFGESNEAKIDIVSGAVIDHNDGTYDVEYTCSSIGKHMLSVCSASGQHLQGSPFKVQCIGAAPHLPMCSLVRSERGGDILYSAESEIVSLGGKRSDGQPARLGQLTACGPPMRVFFRLRDASGESTRPLESSPLVVALLKCEEASDYSRADVIASPTLFDLSESPHSTDDSSTATPADEILYVCTLEVRVAGTFALAPALAGTPAVVGPTLAQFEVVPGRAHLTGCQIVGLQSPSTHGLVSVPFEFTIVTHDAASNRLKQGGEAISITLEGPVTTQVRAKSLLHPNMPLLFVLIVFAYSNAQAPRVTVHDADDGSYAVRFVPHAPGTYAVTLFMGHEQVSSPAMVTISRTGQATSLRQKVPALSMAGLTPIRRRASMGRNPTYQSATEERKRLIALREVMLARQVPVGCRAQLSGRPLAQCRVEVTSLVAQPAMVIRP